MGNYYNPPDNVKTVGRRLLSTTYPKLVAELRDGEALVGLYDRIVFKNAPHLFSQAEFYEFETQVGQGLQREGFFAVCKNKPGFSYPIK